MRFERVFIPLPSLQAAFGSAGSPESSARRRQRSCEYLPAWCPTALQQMAGASKINGQSALQYQMLYSGFRGGRPEGGWNSR
jgi:hypothetical protein